MCVRAALSVSRSCAACFVTPPQGKVKHYVFVGSAGAYAADSVEPMHVEGDKRKASAGARSGPAALCAAKRACRLCLQQQPQLRQQLLVLPAEARGPAAARLPPAAAAAALRRHACADMLLHAAAAPATSPPGHVAVEQYLEQEQLPYTVFQPLYIYGPHTAKDCEQVGARGRGHGRMQACGRGAGGARRPVRCAVAGGRQPGALPAARAVPPARDRSPSPPPPTTHPQWFMDRILRDRPVPIPAPGVQLTSLSHVSGRVGGWGLQGGAGVASRRAGTLKLSAGTSPR